MRRKGAASVAPFAEGGQNSRSCLNLVVGRLTVPNIESRCNQGGDIDLGSHKVFLRGRRHYDRTRYSRIIRRAVRRLTLAASTRFDNSAQGDQEPVSGIRGTEMGSNA
jgi:hypothetical protein